MIPLPTKVEKPEQEIDLTAELGPIAIVETTTELIDAKTGERQVVIDEWGDGYKLAHYQSERTAVLVVPKRAFKTVDVHIHKTAPLFAVQSGNQPVAQVVIEPARTELVTHADARIELTLSKGPKNAESDWRLTELHSNAFEDDKAMKKAFDVLIKHSEMSPVQIWAKINLNTQNVEFLIVHRS